MYLKEIINKSIYGGMGYITSQNDLDILEKYILYNLPTIKEYKQVIVATNYKNYPELTEENTQLWKKYFPDCIIIDSKINRGHNHGYTDLENLLFDWCKENNEEWLCKVSNDIIFEKSILDKEIEEADFYYLNAIGVGGAILYNFDPDRIINEYLIDYFYPQGNFYFLNVSKCDFISDKTFLDKTYEYIKSIPDYNGRIWEYVNEFSCEGLLKECIERNNLSKYHLVSENNYRILLEVIKNYNIHDSSHKNIMIEGICHFHFPNQNIIKI